MIKRFYLTWLFVGMWFTSVFSTTVFPQSPPELQWKVFGHLQKARTEFGIAAIGHGRALVMGGFVEQKGVQRTRMRGEITASCEFIDVVSRRIISAPPMSVPRASAVVLQTIDSNVIIMGGLNTDSTATQVCEIFDHKKNAWRVLGSLLIGRHQHMASFINQEEIIVVGGRAKYAYAPTIAEAEIFNIHTGKSRMIPDFPVKTHAGYYPNSQVVISDRVMFIGGRSGGLGSYRTSNIYSFDTLVHRWSSGIPFPVAASRLAGNRLFDGRLIITGGLQWESSNQYFVLSPNVIIENPKGFSTVGTMIKPRSSSTLEQWGSEIILTMGGLDEKNIPQRHTEWFDLRSNQSFEGPPMNEARANFSSESLLTFDGHGRQQGNCLIVVGGVNLEWRSLSSVEILETANPQLLELPSAEIATRRLQQTLASPTVIITLVVFILVLIIALLYLLYQVFLIRRKSKFSWIDAASEGQKL